MTKAGLVLVVDDDASVRKGLVRILRSAGHAVEAFDDGRRLLSRLSALDSPCCVVSDVRMPGMDGLALQEALRSTGAAASVVFLTAFADVPTTVTAMKRGALDLLEKPAPAHLLISTVATALERARKDAEERHQLGELRERYLTLTPRERQVFALVTAGLLNKQVGFELGTSEKTVKVQRAHVIEKMGAHSLADLVRMADRLGIARSGERTPEEWERDQTPTPTPLATAP